MKKFDFLWQSWRSVIITYGALLFILISWPNCRADGFDFSAGTEYDYISSDYYLLTLDTLAISSDSLDQLKRSNDASNEILFFGKLRFKKEFNSGPRLELYNRTALSNQTFRSNFRLRFQYGLFRLYNDFNIRQMDDSDEETLDQDYLYNRISASLRPSLGGGFYLKFQDRFEFTSYDNPSGYYYNYSFNKIDIMLEREFGLDGLLSVGYRNDVKTVSDSTRLEYDRNIFQVYGEYSPGYKFRVYLDNQYAVKNSQKEDDLDDETRNDFNLRLYFRPNFDFSINLFNQIDYLSFKVQDVVSFNQYYMKNDLELEYSLNTDLTLSLIPHHKAFLAEREIYSRQDYHEYTIEPKIEYMSGTSIWLDFSYELGKRNYDYEGDDVYSDYTLHRLSLLGDMELRSNLRLTVLASIDWEQHTEQADNTTLYFINCSLEYEF